MQTRFRTRPIRSTEELRAAYNASHDGEELLQITSFYLWIFSFLSPRPGSKFLDISCGRGSLLRLAQRRGLAVYGVDLSDKAVRRANDMLGARRVVVADAEHLPFGDDEFQYVTNIGSIEHYLHPEQGVAEIVRVLDPAGIACILLPNSYSLLENIWTVWRTGDVGDQRQPMERYATRAQWERLLTDQGLIIYKTGRYNMPVPHVFSDWGWYLRRPRRLLWLLAAGFVPFNLSGCFVFLCKKRKLNEG